MKRGKGEEGIRGERIFKTLPEDVKQLIEELSGWKEHYNGMRKAEEERMRMLR